MRDLNSLNKVILIGRLGQKPELRVLPQRDRQVARFSLATNERFFNSSTRETTDRTEWHRIVVWGKQAEFCEKYLDQGRQICLEGKIRTRSWQDRDGNKRTTTEIEAESIILIGKKEGPSVPDHAEDSGPADFPTDDPEPDRGGEGEDDIPF